jgi:hypothetical protein
METIPSMTIMSMEDFFKMENALPKIERNTKKIDSLVGRKLQCWEMGLKKTLSIRLFQNKEFDDRIYSFRDEEEGRNYCNFEITTTGIECYTFFFLKKVCFKISMKKLLQYIADYEQQTQPATA